MITRIARPPCMTLALLSCQRLRKSVLLYTDRYWCDRRNSNPAACWLKVSCSTNWATIAYKSRLAHPRELASSPIISTTIIIVIALKRLPFVLRNLRITCLVSQVGVEPTMFQMSEFYRLLQSPLCTLAHIIDHRGMSPVIFVLALTGQASGIYRCSSEHYWRYAYPLRFSNSIILLGQAPPGYSRATWGFSVLFLHHFVSTIGFEPTTYGLDYPLLCHWAICP